MNQPYCNGHMLNKMEYANERTLGQYRTLMMLKEMKFLAEHVRAHPAGDIARTAAPGALDPAAGCGRAGAGRGAGVPMSGRLSIRSNKTIHFEKTCHQIFSKTKNFFERKCSAQN